MLKKQWGTLVCLLLPILGFSAPKIGHEASLQQAFEHFVSSHHIQGAALCVIGPAHNEQQGQIFTTGQLSRKTTVPVNPHSFFPLGALTQSFTALSLAQFVSNGVLSLDEPAAQFLPKSMQIPSYKGQPILVGDLATNTSGLPNLSNTMWNLDNFTSSSLYRYLSNYKLEYAPGSYWKPSNLGYAFLSNLIARFGRSSYSEVLKSTVLEPLALKDTLFALKDRQARGLVIGYEGKNGVSLLKSEKNYSVFLGANGLYSTPYDMLQWLKLHTSKSLPHMKSLLKITLKEYLSIDDFRVALPWKVIEVEGLSTSVYCLGSSMFGYTHYIAFLPGQDIGVCFLGSQAGVEPEIEKFVLMSLKRLKKGVAKRSIKRVN